MAICYPEPRPAGFQLVCARVSNPLARIKCRPLVSVVPWYPEAAGLDERRIELKRSCEGHPDEVCLGLSIGDGGASLGSALAFSNTIVVADFPARPEPENVRILAHELAHLFGASHVQGARLLLDPSALGPDFDPKSASLIRRMRSFRFERDLENPDAATSRHLLDFFAETGSSPATAQIRWGLLLKGDECHQAAAAHFQEAVRLAPLDAAGHFLLAGALRDMGKNEDAIREFRETVRNNAALGDAYEQLGILLAGRGDMYAATNAFRDAVRLSPGDARKLTNLGAVLMRQPGQIRSAHDAFARAMAADPNFAPAREALARAETAQNEIASSIARHRAEVHRNPHSADALYALATALLGEGHFAEAAAVFQATIRLNPRHGAAHSNRAVALFAQRRYVEARAEAEQARKLGVAPPAGFERALEIVRPSKPR